MISVSVRYHNMLKRRAGIRGETLSLPDGSQIGDALWEMAERHGPKLREMLFTHDGEVAPHLVVFCNSKLVPRNRAEFALADGDELMLFPATSGG
jgi:molybdopterin converting factor small subunit